MTFEQFENLRTNLARIQRSLATDGNTKFAAGIIRDQMEQLPLEPGAGKLKPLADAARAAARERFQALEADPAYKAAVTGSVDPDKFVQKFVIRGSRDDVAKMRTAFADNPVAQQTLGVSVLDHLRDQAGIGPGGSGNFSQAHYNRALQGLDPKLQSLVDPKTAEQLQTLGNVARYTQIQPRGSFVNNSNTLVGALADHAGGLVEHGLNMHAHGVPVGSIAKGLLKGRGLNARVKRALAPGAGIGRKSKS